MNTHSKCAAVLPIFVLNEFYEAKNSPKCIICQIFLGEDALNSPTKSVVAKLLFLFLYLYNIICEFFEENKLCKHSTKRSYSIFYTVFR